MQRIIIFLIVVLACCDFVLPQESQYSSLEDIMAGALRGETDAAVYLVGFKHEIEQSEDWDDDSRRVYMNCIQGLVEYCSLVGWYIDQDKIISEAMSLFDQRESEPNNPYTRFLWLMKVRCQYEIKNYDTGINYAQQALKLYEDANDHGYDYSLLLANIAQCYLANEDILSAYLYVEESYYAFDQLIHKYNIHKDKGYYHIQNIRGLVLIALCKYEKAIACFSEIIEANSDETSYSLALNNIAVAYSKMGDHKRAFETLSQVKNLAQGNNSTLLQNLTIECFLDKNYLSALDYLFQYNNAIYKNSFSVLANFSEVEREEFLKVQNKELVFVNNLVSFFAAGGRKEAFDANLYTRSISLAINQAIRQSSGNSPDFELLRHLRNSAIQKSLTPEQRDSIHREILETERKILQNDRNIVAVTDSLIGSMDKISNKLKDNEVIVQFCYLPLWMGGEVDPHYGAFIITEGVSIPELVLLGNVDEVNELFYNTAPSIEFINSLYSGENASKLYNKLWAPLETYLTNKEIVYYSVVGPLSLINFDALIDLNGIRLRDKFEISMLSSPAIILNNPISVPQISNFVAFASPNFNISKEDMESRSKDYTVYSGCVIDEQLSMRGDLLRGNWQSLPGTKTEAEKILRILKKCNHSESHAYFSEEASEEAFKSLSGNSPKILHIATHGFVISNQSQYDSSQYAKSVSGVSPKNNYMLWSGLVLAGGNNTWRGESMPPDVEDGILTADEISRLDLSGTELLVLSACETARGHIDPVEGVWGLQRAFKQAGVRTILMTLWKIPDSTTSLFMEHFYKKLVNGVPVRKAVKDAQNYLIDNGITDPYYWAPFVVID